MNPLIFLSYSSKDKLVADAICSRLENQGIRCWIAPRDVKPGSDYSNQIADALEAATMMVMVFSSDSNNSRHVKSEIDRAFSLGKIIIPFRVENVELDKGLAYYLAKTHWLDAVTKPLEQHIDRLAVTVRQISGEAAPEISQRPAPPTVAPPAPAPKPASNRMPWVIAGVVVICGIAGCALLFVLLNQRKSDRAEASNSAVAAATPSPSTAPKVTKKSTESAPVSAANQDMFEGSWKITEAETLAGNSYTGTAEVHQKGNRYEVAWRSTASTASGIGLAHENKLCVAWGSAEFGVVFYKIGGDGTLRGRWTTTTAPGEASPGREEASGGSPTSVEGEYVIKGTNPGGTAPYEGRLQIVKTGRTYQLKWILGDVVTSGVGLKIDDSLFVAWATDKEPFGVVALTFEPGQAKGVWTLGGATQIAPENWKR